MKLPDQLHQSSRRTFLANGSLLLGTAAGLNLSTAAAEKERQDKPLRFGLITDLHYADKPPAGSRYYKETPDKLAEAAETFAKHKRNFIVELGDFIDAADSIENEIRHLKRIDRDFKTICPNRHYVLGNHCVHTLKKQEFLEVVERPKSYYSFDSGGWHFVVLDSCFRSDGQPYERKNFVWTDPNIPAEELEWLKSDLTANKKHTIIFAHQRLDVSNQHGVKNGADVRTILEHSGHVRAVFQGHSHSNDHKEIGGIHYCTMVAMVEGSGAANNGYSNIEAYRDGMIRIDGFRNQHDYDWRPANAK